jgi:hypothetical protein
MMNAGRVREREGRVAEPATSHQSPVTSHPRVRRARHFPHRRYPGKLASSSSRDVTAVPVFATTMPLA